MKRALRELLEMADVPHAEIDRIVGVWMFHKTRTLNLLKEALTAPPSEAQAPRPAPQRRPRRIVWRW